ncbi:MAG: uroporphyrinogen-III C-methyltransferase [Woeseiaceae bacterium]
MSDTDKDQELEATEEAVESNPDTTAQEDTPAVEPAEEQPPVKQRGSGLAWLALLVSLLALAAVGYTLSKEWLAAKDSSADDALASLDTRLTATREGLSSIDKQLAELAERDSATTAETDALRQELDERVKGLSSLPARLSTLEGSVSSLAGISSGTRDTWLLAEAEYYMQIANAQLQLANNPHLAALALEMADERVVQIGNPALIDVRRAISDELAALDVMEKPDIAGATLTLASLARVVESLPLGSSKQAVEKEAQPADEEQSGLSRAWSSMKSAMSGLVRVTPPDQAKLALLSPDAEYFLRNNLALQLQSARLALLRGEQTVFQQTLDDTSTLMSRYFDIESAQVISAQETLAEIRNSVFTSSVPDISGSLNLLRQFRTLSESSE